VTAIDPLTLTQLREHSDDVRAVAEQLRADHPGSLYFPFYFWGGSELRPMQPYLNKLPAELVDALPQLAEAVASYRDVTKQGSSPAELPVTLGDAYREATVSSLPAARRPFTVDPALVERGLKDTPTRRTNLRERCVPAESNPAPGGRRSQTSISHGRQMEPSSSPRSRASPTRTKKSSSGLASDRCCVTATG
jgi:hypothetical protein